VFSTLNLDLRSFLCSFFKTFASRAQLRAPAGDLGAKGTSGTFFPSILSFLFSSSFPSGKLALLCPMIFPPFVFSSPPIVARATPEGFFVPGPSFYAHFQEFLHSMDSCSRLDCTYFNSH